MDALRKHHLYPRLVELARDEATLGRIIREIPADELTIMRALCAACCWHIRGTLDYSHAEKIEDALGKIKPDEVTPDGYFARYSVTFDQCWPGIIKDIAAYGLHIWRSDGKIYLGYAHVPDVYVSIVDKHTGRPFSRHELQFDLTALQHRMIGKYGTPYQEEVIALQLLERLPQPIAEAISDCIHGVMERRFIRYYNPAIAYPTKQAVEDEIRYTAHPARVYPEYIVKKMADKRDWEKAAAALIEEERAVAARRENEERIRANRKALKLSDSSEEDPGVCCVYGRDDGW